MSREHIDKCLLNLAAQLPPYDPVLIVNVLIDEYKKRSAAIPEATRHVILGVIAIMTKHNADAHECEAVTANVLASLRNKR